MTRAPASPGHLLLYEPRTEGHHLGWLRFITEDLVSAGFELSLAVDLRPAAQSRLGDHLAELLPRVKLLPAYDARGRRHGDRKAGSVAHCLRESGAAHVFLCAFDEIASHCWRRAAFGRLPPRELRGRMGGIYHRPRFLAAPWWSANRWLKQIGFRRLLRGGWLRQLLFVDEYLARDCQAASPGAPIFFLPDPCPEGFDMDAAEARVRLGVPAGRRVFLFYGGGYRRKGLGVVVPAMLQLAAESSGFLLCVGQQHPQGETARGLDALVRQGRARLIDRYVSAEEEKLSFAASDVVLLPYLNHFGTSGVLSRAMAAGRMVIVSDEQLLGRLTREHGLGLRFRSGDCGSLAGCLREAEHLPSARVAAYAAAAARYAARYSRTAYRSALLKSLAAEPVVLHG